MKMVNNIRFRSIYIFWLLFYPFSFSGVMTTSTCADSINFHMMMNGNFCAEYYAVQCPVSCGTCTPKESTSAPTTTTASCADAEGTIVDENGK